MSISALRKIYRSPRWKDVRIAVFQRDGRRCVKCGTARKLEIHHKVPISKGGSWYDWNNLEARCRDCHIDEHHGEISMDQRAWRNLIAHLMVIPMLFTNDANF